jgi:hypothetical protein
MPLYASMLEYNNRHYYYLRQEVMFLSAFVHSLPRYDGLEAWQTSKSQNRRSLFDVELYLTVHKSFVSTSLNIIHRGCTRFISAILIERLLQYMKIP